MLSIKSLFFCTSSKLDVISNLMSEILTGIFSFVMSESTRVRCFMKEIIFSNICCNRTYSPQSQCPDSSLPKCILQTTCLSLKVQFMFDLSLHRAKSTTTLFIYLELCAPCDCKLSFLSFSPKNPLICILSHIISIYHLKEEK